MSLKRRAYFFTTGIRNFPGDAKNFTGRAVTHVQTHADYVALNARAEKIEYLSLAITRPFGESMRADKLARTAGNEFYRDSHYEKIHVVHSNGGDVFCDAFESDKSLVCKRVHFVCPANNSDFETNGLNQWLIDDRIGEVVVYVAGKDAALKMASTWIARKILRFGTLGLDGPRNVAPSVKSRVHLVKDGPWVEYDHSDCWSDEKPVTGLDNFTKTMRLFL